MIGAFHELSTDRPWTMGGPGPIPRATVTDFIREEGIENRRLFRRLIRQLDLVFLAHHAPKKD